MPIAALKSKRVSRQTFSELRLAIISWKHVSMQFQLNEELYKLTGKFLSYCSSPKCADSAPKRLYLIFYIKTKDSTQSIFLKII